MRWPQIVLLVFGLITLGMGIEAYAVKQSVMSLVGGGGLGVLLLVAFGLTFKFPRFGYILGLLATIALAARFIPSYLKTQKVYPDMIMSGLSVLVIVLLLGAHFAAQAKRA